MAHTLALSTLWKEFNFSPNSEQEQAITHTAGTLFLTAGPGSSKTRVLLWRTLNLIVFHGVKPTEIFLSTFTEKAAHQLREGLRSLRGLTSHFTHQPYDLKIHDAETVRKDVEKSDSKYAQQLNVYAYIWCNLRGQQLDATAIIATALPQALKDAIETHSASTLSSELATWQPVVPIPFDQSRVDQTIADFSATVDRIEENHFAPASLKSLRERITGSAGSFASRVCRNCDARFSCDSYRDYFVESSSKRDTAFKQIFADFGNEEDHEIWMSRNLDS